MTESGSAKDLIRDLCALTFEDVAQIATAKAMAIGGETQLALGSEEFTTATSANEIIRELSPSSADLKLSTSIEVMVERHDRGLALCGTIYNMILGG